MTRLSDLLDTPAYCPGKYCGRTDLGDGKFSDCGACPRGFHSSNSTYICVPCDELLSRYDWLYLGFMALLALVLHLFFIDMVSMRRSFSKEVLALHATAIIEMVLACLLTLLLTDPIGSFNIHTCPGRSPADFYTMFHNPNVLFEKTLICTQEAVYPLQTMVFTLHSLALIIMLLLRPWVCSHCLPRQSKMSIYAAMYFLPILAIIHTIGGGAFYHAFPFLTLILSATSSAAHFAVRLNQSWRALIIGTIVDVRNLVILIGHWTLHAYGIYSLLTFKEIILHPFIIVCCVPLPALFYVATVKFTDPNKLL